jgi:OmpA-OmpF porin, OOP family
MNDKRPTPHAPTIHRLARASLVAVTALAATAPALAQDSPFYGGLNLSAPRWDDAVNGVSGSNSGTGFKVYGGWQASPNFALEAGAMGLGTLKGSTGDVRARGAFVDAVGTLPIAPQWNLLGRAGVINAKTTSPTGSDRGFGVKLGAGAEYQFSKTLAVRGEWERYRLNAFGSHPNTDQLSIGLKMGF